MVHIKSAVARFVIEKIPRENKGSGFIECTEFVNGPQRKVERSGRRYHTHFRVSTAILQAGPFRPHRVKDTALRECLRHVGFTEEAVGQVLEDRTDRNIDVPCALRRTAEPLPLHVLIRTFILGLPMSEDAVRAAVAPVSLEWLQEVRLIRRVGGAVRAVARLLPWHDLILLGDFLPPYGRALRPDFVMSGTSSSSLSLTRLTVRRRVGTALDLGTGAGTHALLAASHADRVIATDTNLRALNFAWMNACLNGIGNVSFKQGSFFEPVADERFDLIVSNPPFVISPRSHLMFQNPGLGGDAVSELVVRQAPAHLNEGGCAVSLISWTHESAEDWEARPCRWAEGNGCDFWLLHGTSEGPLEYAAHALRQTEAIRNARYAAQLAAWVDYYGQQNIGHLALGAAILRKRRASRHWVRCEDLSGVTLSTEAGEQIQRIFAAEDFLAGSTGEDELLDCPVVLHPDHVLEQQLVAGQEGWVCQSLMVKAAHGLERRMTIDGRVLQLLSHCDGKRTVGELIAHVAAEAAVDFATAKASGLRLVCRLLRAGLLTVRPPQDSTSTLGSASRDGRDDHVVPGAGHGSGSVSLRRP